jgi:hypothetical protein
MFAISGLLDGDSRIRNRFLIEAHHYAFDRAGSVVRNRRSCQCENHHCKADGCQALQPSTSGNHHNSSAVRRRRQSLAAYRLARLRDHTGRLHPAGALGPGSRLHGIRGELDRRSGSSIQIESPRRIPGFPRLVERCRSGSSRPQASQSRIRKASVADFVRGIPAWSDSYGMSARAATACKLCERGRALPDPGGRCRD